MSEEQEQPVNILQLLFGVLIMIFFVNCLFVSAQSIFMPEEYEAARVEEMERDYYE